MKNELNESIYKRRYRRNILLLTLLAILIFVGSIVWFVASYRFSVDDFLEVSPDWIEMVEIGTVEIGTAWKTNAPEVEPKINPLESIGKRQISFYTSTPEQTDNSPCIGAGNKDLCRAWQEGESLCASNEFPLGTELFIGDLGTCTVVDKMNIKHPTRIDFYMGFDSDCLDGYQTGDICPQYFGAIEGGIFEAIVTKINGKK